MAVAATLTHNLVITGYIPTDNEACGLLLYEAGRVNVQNNTITGNETNICNEAGSTTGGHVKP